MVEGKQGLKIEKDFEFLIPPLTDEECEPFEKNIIKYGCSDPIKVWAPYDTILDGHNRFRICTRKGIKFEVMSIELETREDALNWIIENQLGRRNLTATQRSYLLGKRYLNEKKAAHRPDVSRHNDLF